MRFRGSKEHLRCFEDQMSKLAYLLFLFRIIVKQSMNLIKQCVANTICTVMKNLVILQKHHYLTLKVFDRDGNDFEFCKVKS